MSRPHDPVGDSGTRAAPEPAPNRNGIRVAAGAAPLRGPSLSVGEQSTAALKLSLHGELPRFDAVVSANPQREQQATSRTLWWCTQQGRQARIPLYLTSAGDIFDRWSQTPVHTTVDGQTGMARRQRTTDSKIAAARRAVRRLWQAAGRPPVLQADGISLDKDRRASTSGVAYSTAWHPLLDDPEQVPRSREDCEQWLAQHDYPVSVKTGCVCRPSQDDHSRTETGHDEAGTWNIVVDLDRQIRPDTARAGFKAPAYRHRRAQPLPDRRLPSPRPHGSRSLTLTLDWSCNRGCGL